MNIDLTSILLYFSDNSFLINVWISDFINTFRFIVQVGLCAISQVVRLMPRVGSNGLILFFINQNPIALL